MNITINGIVKNLNVSNLDELVRAFCPNAAIVISELNGTIIPGAERSKTAVKDGDAVELVSFVGGG